MLYNNLQVSSRLHHSDIRSETCSHSKVAVLFSGGLDSAVIAALADKCIPENEQIDLINIAFQIERNESVVTHRKDKRKNKEDTPTQEQVSNTDAKFNVPDRLTGWKTYQELISISPNRMWNFIEVCVT
jgi:7-cyano-7-deazaguanine synthase in queuosine biosynthesis